MSSDSRLGTRDSGRRFRGDLGLTLLEVLISASLLAVVLAATFGIMLTGADSYNEGMSVADVEGRAKRAVDLMADDLLSAGIATLTPIPQPPFGSSTIDFQQNTNYTAGAIVWGNPIRFAIDTTTSGERRVVKIDNPGAATASTAVLTRGVAALLEGETANGADDNGNGLLDEGGLSFVLVGETVTIRLTIEATAANGDSIVRTVETSVKLRN